jgi:maleate isomerase
VTYTPDNKMVSIANDSPMPAIRVGMIVPSSNVTMETEVPLLLHQREQRQPERFTFHSSRVRMKRVELSELAAMNAQGADAAAALADADCDVIAYACLVAAMIDSRGYAAIEADLQMAASSDDREAPVISSAGALIEAIKHLGAQTVAVVAPYLPALTDTVLAGLRGAGIDVCDSISLGVDDNLQVAQLPPSQLPALARQLDIARADAVILSACVQMPSLESIAAVESELNRPVLTAASATTWKILDVLGLRGHIKGAGTLLE